MQRTVILSSSLRKNNACRTFYRPNEMKFVRMSSSVQIPRISKKLNINRNPWQNIGRPQLEQIIKRIEDTPATIQAVIRRKQELQRQKKFTQLHPGKENEQGLKQKIKGRREKYERQYRELIKNKKELIIATNLPKIIHVSHVSKSTRKKYGM